MTGIDTPYNTAGLADKIKVAGHSFVIRYISPNSSKFPSKRITRAEAAMLRVHGLAIGFVWETLSDISVFSTQLGHSHAEAAMAVLGAVGAPKGTAIYFAVDFDAVPAQLPAIDAYFKAVGQSLAASGYAVGVYGSGLVLQHLANQKLATAFWLAQSLGWSGSRGFGNYDIAQGQSTRVAGIDVDLNTLHGGSTLHGAGLWI